jgi:uncharacterized protein YcnI
MMRNLRAVAVSLGAAAAGAVAFAAPAAADVTVTPPVALRGGPAQLAFHIPEERTGAYTTKVELLVPQETPIAEIYPMSVDNWAPQVVTRQIDHPVELIHGTSTTEVPASISWIWAGDAAPTPGQSAELRISLGPMPQVDRVVFTVVQTYSDGTVVRWADQPAGGAQSRNPAPTVTLVDETATSDPNGGGSQPGDAAAAAQNGDPGDNGAQGILGAGLLVGLAAGVGFDGWLIHRQVRRNGPVAAKSSLAASE